MKNSFLLFTLFSSLLIVCACQSDSANAIKKEAPLKIGFDRSDIYIPKSCEQLTNAIIFVRSSLKIDKNLDFEVQFEKETLAEFNLKPPTDNIGQLVPNYTNKRDFEIEIPAFAKHRKSQINCIVQCITEGYQEYSESITVHYVDFDEAFEYINFKGNITDLMEQRYWDDYEGPPMPPSRSYLVKDFLKSEIYKEKNQFKQKMNYQLTLVDEETNEEIKIEPDLFLEHTFSEKMDLETGIKISDSNSKMGMLGEGTQSSFTYRTNSHQNLAPGYQIYGQYKGDLIQAKFVGCDSMSVLEKEKLMIPSRILFKCFPKIK